MIFDGSTMRTATIAVVLGFGLVAGAAACSSKPSVGSGTTVKLSGSTNVCTALPFATVSKITGQSYVSSVKAAPDPFGPPDAAYNCDYTSADNSVFIKVEIDGNASAAQEYDEQVHALQSIKGVTATPISDLGKKAMIGHEANVTVVYVELSNALVYIDSSTSLDADAAKNLVAAVVSGLNSPPAA